MTISESQLPVATTTASHVSARNLFKRIEDRPILRDINLEIPRGQFIALLGANGAGKSTLLKILATLIPASSGTLELFGLPIRSSATLIRRRIGLISHQSMLYGDLTALENLVFFAKLYGVNEPTTRAMQLLETLGLRNRAHDCVKSFSRGMTQRVAIGRALIHDPELLLADEPFAGLDAPSTAILENVLTNLHKTGKTIILANHDIPQSLRLVSRAVVLVKGRKQIDAASTTLDPQNILLHMEGGAA